VRTLILIGTAFGLGAGLVCTSLFAWWLSHPVRFTTGYVESGALHMESVDPMPFLVAGLIVSACLGAFAGYAAAHRGWRLTRHGVA